MKNLLTTFVIGLLFLLVGCADNDGLLNACAEDTVVVYDLELILVSSNVDHQYWDTTKVSSDKFISHVWEDLEENRALRNAEGGRYVVTTTVLDSTLSELPNVAEWKRVAVLYRDIVICK